MVFLMKHVVNYYHHKKLYFFSFHLKLVSKYVLSLSIYLRPVQNSWKIQLFTKLNNACLSSFLNNWGKLKNGKMYAIIVSVIFYFLSMSIYVPVTGGKLRVIFPSINLKIKISKYLFCNQIYSWNVYISDKFEGNA